MIDYKEWITNKADDIAFEQYGCDFYDLDEHTQTKVFSDALEAHKDYQADLIDRALDMLRGL